MAEATAASAPGIKAFNEKWGSQVNAVSRVGQAVAPYAAGLGALGIGASLLKNILRKKTELPSNYRPKYVGQPKYLEIIDEEK